MPLHPAFEKMLQQMKELGAPPISSLTPEQFRKNSAQSFALLRKPGLPVAHVEDRIIAVYGNRQTPIRIYTPEGEGPFPALIYIHGGGWVFGELDQFDNLCRMFTHTAGCVTISVDYGLAPEYKFPHPVEECYAVSQWVFEHADEFKIRKDKIAIGGDSAGGNLSAVVCQVARDRGGSMPSLQLLLYPSVDLLSETESKRLNSTGYLLDIDSMMYFRKQYLNSMEDASHPMASPLLAEDLRHLPPAIVITAEYDPLRDEGEAYASALEKAGVPAKVKRFEGMIHGFLTLDHLVPEVRAQMQEVAEMLKTEFTD